MYDNLHVTLARTVAPAIAPITLTEVKDWLRIDSSDEDSILKNLIGAVTAYAETYTRRAFITQTWKMETEDFPRDSDSYVPGYPRLSGRDFIRLPRQPVQSISSIKYYDNADTLQTFASSNYTHEDDRVYLKDTATWASDTRNGMPVEITVVCGYGDKTTDIPDDLRFALTEHVAFMYENRGSDKIPASALSVYKQFRKVSFGRLIG